MNESERPAGRDDDSDGTFEGILVAIIALLLSAGVLKLFEWLWTAAKV